jgi:hypothetical protein
MSNNIYPTIKGLTYTVVKTPQWANISQRLDNGNEISIPQRKNPIWHWQLKYDYVYDNFKGPNNTMPFAPYTDMQTLLGFFLACRADADDFLFLDPAGNSFGPALLPDGSAVNPRAALPIIRDDDGTFYTPLQINHGGLFYEDVTDLAPLANQFGSLMNVYVGDARNPKSYGSDYQLVGPGITVAGVTYDGLLIRWSGGTNYSGLTAYAEFNYYQRVQFEGSTLSFEKWAHGLYTLGGSQAKNSSLLKLMTSRGGGYYQPPFGGGE